jgi:enoyl-CoA hydratase
MCGLRPYRLTNQLSTRLVIFLATAGRRRSSRRNCLPTWEPSDEGWPEAFFAACENAAMSSQPSLEPRLGAPSGVVVDREGPVTVVTIDRPERRNAVDSRCATRLLQVFEEFEADEGSSVAVFTGAGGTFCAGADLKAISEGDRRPIPDRGPGPMGPTRLTLSKPVVAAVEGFAVAGGLELALWCDLRVAAEDAVFGVFCRRFGVPLCDLGTVRLPRIIGHGRAMDLILSGRAVAGPEALAMGLVNRLVAPGRARQAAVELAHELAALPQVCLRSDRMSALEQWGLSEEEAAVNEARRGRDVISSGETLAGAAQFAKGAGRGGTQVR